jgi:hypothetical protein
MLYFESYLSSLVFDWVRLPPYNIARFEGLTADGDLGFQGMLSRIDWETVTKGWEDRCAPPPPLFSVEQSRCLTLNPKVLWSFETSVNLCHSTHCSLSAPLGQPQISQQAGWRRWDWTSEKTGSRGRHNSWTSCRRCFRNTCSETDCPQLWCMCVCFTQY